MTGDERLNDFVDTQYRRLDKLAPVFQCWECGRDRHVLDRAQQPTLGPIVITVSISGDTMALTMPDGTVERKYRQRK